MEDRSGNPGGVRTQPFFLPIDLSKKIVFCWISTASSTVKCYKWRLKVCTTEKVSSKLSGSPIGLKILFGSRCWKYALRAISRNVNNEVNKPSFDLFSAGKQGSRVRFLYPNPSLDTTHVVPNIRWYSLPPQEVSRGTGLGALADGRARCPMTTATDENVHFEHNPN